LADRKDTLADSVNNLQQDLEQAARSMGAGQGQGQQRAARQLKDAADSLARERVAERIRDGKQALDGGRQGANRTDERALERSLNSVSERLQAAEQSARSTNGSSAEENLDRTRQLADNLDSLRRRLDENAHRDGNGQQQRNQQGQQGKQGEQGQQGQRGSQESQQQANQQQAGGTQGGSQSLRGPRNGPDASG